MNKESSTTQIPLASLDDEEVNLREMFDVVLSGKWIVSAVTLTFLLVGIAYAYMARPVYEADGLVQVEQEKSGITKTMDQLSSLISGGAVEASAEIAVLKSRMVLSSVVHELKLHIFAEPNYFPLVGEPIARYRGGAYAELVRVPALRTFAWGGERIRITALELPVRWQGEPLVLEALGDSAFVLMDEGGRALLRGKVGERVSVEVQGGAASIFVQELLANPGTTFDVMLHQQQAVLQDLGERLTVAEQPRDSGVLSLKIKDHEPEMAARLINEIENAYLRQNVERRTAQAEQSLEFLQKQLPELKEKVDAAQAQLNNYQMQKGTVDVQRETDLVLTQSVSLETERLKLVQERDAALQRFTAQHPVIITLNEQIRGIEREQTLLRKQVEALPEKQQEILSLMRDVEVNGQLYTALLNSAQELQVTKAGTVGNVRIVDQALPPLEPVSPRRPAIIALSGVLGLFFGVLAVLAMRTMLRGVDKPEDVERMIGLPTYASIPVSVPQRKLMGRRGLRKNASSGLLAVTAPDDVAMEALRSLRTSLHFAMLEATNNVVMITGPMPELGKSFVSINFGAVLAVSGKRVLVIDADLRRGHLHSYAGLAQQPGLSDCIAGTVELSTTIQACAIPGLDVLTCGARAPNPAELLMSERFDAVLKQVQQRYDYVLIDTPPVLPVTDAAIVGRMAGTTLLVLKSSEHPMRMIEEAARRLRQAGVQLRGVIFNKVGARVGSHGYGSYGRKYGYSRSNYSTVK